MAEEAAILIVDKPRDDRRMYNLIQTYLKSQGYRLEVAHSFKEAIYMTQANRYDLILIDNCTEIDAYSLSEEIRNIKSTPVVMLNSCTQESSAIRAFEAGVDDYIIKPFSPRELLYRIKAILRRTSSNAHLDVNYYIPQVLIVGDLVIDYDACQVCVGNNKVNLAPKEYAMLCYMVENPGKVLSREVLLRDIWNYDFIADPRTVDTHIKRIREKLGEFSENAAAAIVTVWGVGYRFESPTAS